MKRPTFRLDSFHRTAALNGASGSPEYADELEFLEHRVTPWYWRGHRNKPILGPRVELDTWGAPRGFEPPVHLRLMHSLAPLTTAVRRVINSHRDDMAAHLERALGKIPELRLARFSPAAVHLERLKSVLHSHGDNTDTIAALKDWYSDASSADRELARDVCA